MDGIQGGVKALGLLPLPAGPHGTYHAAVIELCQPQVVGPGIAGKHPIGNGLTHHFGYYGIHGLFPPSSVSIDSVVLLLGLWTATAKPSPPSPVMVYSYPAGMGILVTPAAAFT